MHVGAQHRPGRPRGSAPFVLFLLLICWATYSGAPGNGFVFDDGAYFLEDSPVRRGLTLESVRWAFTSTFAGNWFPATLLSHLLDVQLFGLAPAGHHVTSVLLHSANAILLFLLLGRATGACWRSFLVAVLFAVHPLHVESVAWVSARKDVLSTFFGLLALGAYLDYARRPRVAAYMALCSLFALSLLAKSMLVTLPFLLLLLDWWPLGRLGPASRPDGGRRRWAVVLEKAPLLALAEASGAATFLAQQQWGAVTVSRYYDLPARLGNALVAYAAYLGKTVWPTGLSAFYPHQGSGLPAWRWIAAAVVLLSATALLVVLRRSRPALLTGWLWYLGTLVPVIGLVQVGQQAIADRYTYVPLIGLFLIAAWVTTRFTADRVRTAAPVLLCAAALVAAALAATARSQVRVWKDDVTLFSHAARAVPDNWLAELNLAVALEAEGREQDAIDHYLEALRTNYYLFGAHASLAKILDRRGALRPAIERYRFALMIDPGNAEIRLAYARALARNGQLEEALAAYSPLSHAGARQGDPIAERTALLLALSRRGEALEGVRQIAPSSGGEAMAVVRLGAILEGFGRREDAASAYRWALTLDPSNAHARRALGRLHPTPLPPN